MMSVRAEAKATLQLVRCAFHACADCATAATKHADGALEIDSTRCMACTHDLDAQRRQLALQRPSGGGGGSDNPGHTHATGAGTSVGTTASIGNSGASSSARPHGGNNTSNAVSSTSTSNNRTPPSGKDSIGVTAARAQIAALAPGISASGKRNGAASRGHTEASQPQHDADADVADSSKGQGGIAVKVLDSVLSCDGVHVRGCGWLRKGLSLHGCTARLVSTTIADCHELGVHMVGGNTTLTGCKIDCCGQGFVADGSSATTKVQAGNCVFTRGVCMREYDDRVAWQVQCMQNVWGDRGGWLRHVCGIGCCLS